MSETAVKDEAETPVREPVSSAPGESSDEAQQSPPRPIITYPEFLTRREGRDTAARTLLTTQRLLNTLYISLSAYAMLYAGTEYLIKPMVEQLTEARHELHRHADAKLQRLNRKLEGIISILPPGISKQEIPQANTDTDNDVTACFHQNAATQTGSSLENLPSIASSSEPDKGASPGSTSMHIIKLHRTFDPI